MRALQRFGVLAFALAVSAPALVRPLPAAAQPYVSVTVTAPAPPPPLPFYEQPPIPGPDYLWTPGYWAWDDFDAAYYWVPGTWVMAPEPGLLWTPGYWGWNDGAFLFHSGYWGPHVGFYGGVAYGFGYTGFGYQGGYWNRGSFFYNTSVNRVSNVNITNVYNQTVVINRTTINNVSYNGGPGGVTSRPNAQEAAFQREPRFASTPMQMQHQRLAASTPALFASANGGHPPIAATPNPGAFRAQGVVSARGAPLFQGQVRANPYRPAFSPAGSGQGGYPQQRPNQPFADRHDNAGGGQGRADTRDHSGFPGQRNPPQQQGYAQPGFNRTPYSAPQFRPPGGAPSNGFAAPRQPSFRALPRPPATPRPPASHPPKRDHDY